MIYFDNNKEAHSYEIQDPLATVDYDTWAIYSGTEVGICWDIVDGQFVQITSVDDMIYRASSIERVRELKRLLADTDYKAAKYSEGYYTDEEYEPTKTARAGWRAEINVLQDLQNK